jgi:hypothetical protein
VVLPSFRVLTGAACFLLSCSFAIEIEVTGSIGEGIVFRAENPAPILAAVPLERLVVVQAGTGGELDEHTVWEIIGDGRTTLVQYGRVPKGFREMVKAAPLDEKRSYQVHAVASGGWISGGGSAHCEFSFTTDGSVRPGRGCAGEPRAE